MTQEEKARAYDEALERAKVLRQEAIDKGYALDYIKDYETIFPELAESEDERIRKEIIHYILYKADGVSEEQEHSWIAYLEKQKGSLHVSESCQENGNKLPRYYGD